MKYAILVFFCFLQFFNATISVPRYIDVHTPLGTYRGIKTYSEGRRAYWKFRGIRYGLSTEGRRRFTESLPFNDSWQEPNLVPAYKAGCMGFDNLNPYRYTLNYTFKREYMVTGQEDCLYLNIHTRSSINRRPVIFFIHGGAFSFGDPSQYDSDYIMNRDVIYVNIAYRLGPLGFFSTGDDVVPGNMGLKDQLLALQWVNKNIELFGGDKNRITITGVQAGGASVHYMYMSPLTNGLFQRGFTHSGTATAPWAIIQDVQVNSRKLACVLKCPSSPTRQMVDCLRKVDATELVKATAKFKAFLFNPFTIFGPIVDRHFTDNPYIPSHPRIMLFQGQFKQLPLITGVTAEDGLYSSSEWIFNVELMCDVIKNWEQYAPYIFFYNKCNCLNTAYELQKWALEHSSNFSISYPAALLQIISYQLYIYPALHSTMLMTRWYPSSDTPVRLYYFRYRGAASTSDEFKNKEDSHDDLVGHADDSAYIYKMPGMDLRVRDQDRAMSEEMIDLLTTYAENGNLPVSFQMFDTVRPFTGTYRFLDIKEPKTYKFALEKSLLSPFLEHWMNNCYHY